MRMTRITQLTILGVTALLTTGCTGIAKKPADGSSWMSRMPWASDKQEAPQPYPDPAKVAATWTADVLTQSGRTPTRGFGGRVFFYDKESKVVPVEGTLVIHGFDEKASDPKSAMKRFVFTPEQFTRHFSNSDLGASYSIWLPWDAVGGDQREISLVASFVTEEGKTVQGLPAKVSLPGKSEPQADSLARRMSPQYLAWKDASKNTLARSTGLTTTTIGRKPTSPASKTEMNSDSALIAAGDATPSVDLSPSRKPQRFPALPASYHR
ncbi:MAG: hypothetical protein AAGA03_12785 [Planctomycetota bacterium]